MKALAPFFAAAFLCGFILAADDKPLEKFDLAVTNDSLASVLRMLSEKSGHAIFAANVEDDTLITTLDLKQTTWREVLERIAKEKNFTLAENAAWGKLILLERAEPVSLNFQNTDVRDALNAWAIASNRNIVVPPDVQGNVSLAAQNIPAAEALAKIAAAAKCQIINAPFNTAIVLGAESLKKWNAARAAERAYVFGTNAAPAPVADKKISLKPRALPIGLLFMQLHPQIDFITSGKLDNPQQEIAIEINELPGREMLELIARRYAAGIDAERHGAPAIYFRDNNSNVSFVFNNADVRDVINATAIQADWNVFINADVEGRISARIDNVPAEAVMRMILNPLGIALAQEPENIWRCLSAQSLLKECGPIAQGLRISLLYKNAALSEVVAAVAKQANAEIKFAEGLKPSEMVFTGRLTSIHWKHALIAILKNYNLRLSEQAEGKFVITNAPDSKP